MPYNLLKKYNELLDLLGLPVEICIKSLRGIFKRDFEESQATFNGKPVYPTPKNNGELPMQTLFTHLTTEMTDKVTRHRSFEIHRSERLHWLRYHLDEKKQDNMLLFSVNEPEGIRTYYYDEDENYVLILEPGRDKSFYYLLTAYPVRGKDKARDKIRKKYRRRLAEIY